VHDPAHAVALVVVRAGADHEHALAPGVTMLRSEPTWPASAGALKPVTSVAGIVAVVSPMRSAALPQPLPSVRAMSCRSTPVRRAMSAAARGDLERVGGGVVERIGVHVGHAPTLGTGPAGHPRA
jgi:hypothetical protein